jgi:hypothetical protein
MGSSGHCDYFSNKTNKDIANGVRLPYHFLFLHHDIPNIEPYITICNNVIGGLIQEGK